MTDQQQASTDQIMVPDFIGMQTLNAWLAGHDTGLLLQGPDPDSPHPLLHGIVVAQKPGPGARLSRWDTVTVWIDKVPGAGRSPQ